MRIGIDMLGVQSPGSRGRGIGRYARSLVGAMIRGEPGVEFVLYSHERLPTGEFPEGGNARVERLRAGVSAGRAVDGLARENRDGLDALLLTAPFELYEDYEPPAKPLRGLAMATVVYDLVAFLYPEDYLTYAPAAARLCRSLERLRAYDALLAISEATRRDVVGMLGMDGGRVTTVGGASDPGFFRPGEGSELEEDAAILKGLGVEGAFVFGLSNMEERKNLGGVLGAFGGLPEELRAGVKLVLAGAFREEDWGRVRDEAEGRGFLDALVTTGPVGDGALRALYRGCRAFVFPSRFEGFGLPLLEAMQCGAVVVGGDNSSQVEVVGDAGLLVDVESHEALAGALARVLGDGGLAGRLRRRGVERAGRFRWEETARRAIGAIREAVGRSTMARRRVAVIGDWSARGDVLRFVREVGRDADVDLYYTLGYEPLLGEDEGRFRVFDERLLGRNLKAEGYERVYRFDAPGVGVGMGRAVGSNREA